MKVLTTAGLTKLIQLCKNAIPTVNNPTITITQGGVTKGSFTLNQASGDTIALDAGGGGSVPDATDQVKGIAKLYNTYGLNTDGSMTQSAITNEIINSVNTREISEGKWIDIWFSSYWSGTRVYLEDIKNQSSTTYATYLSTLSDLYTNRSATMATLKIPYNSGRTCYLYLVDNNEYYFFLPKDGKRLRVYDDNGTIKFEEAMFKDFALMSDLPTVNDSTITITQGGVTKGSFTLNQASGDTIALDAGGIYHPELLSHEWDDHERTDASWVNALTFSWQNKADHLVAYNELATNISGKSLTSETVAGVTIQFYQADNGRKICPDTEESNVASIYTATGVAWYYIIDTVNERFKLPRAKHNKYADSLGVVGTGMTLGLTNGTSTGSLTSSNSANVNPVIANNGYGASVGTITGHNAWTDYAAIGVTSDATKSGIVAQQTEDTDQYKYLYFYVGNYTQTALENTAGLNASLFNNKVDLDAGNLSTVGKSTVAGLAMPSSTYDNLTLGASGSTYTAPADGWIYLSKVANATDQYISMNGKFAAASQAYTAGITLTVSIPASKGNIITIWYSANGTTNDFKFIYANGAA